MFDGPTSAGLDLDARLVVLDLSAVGDELLPILNAVRGRLVEQAWGDGTSIRRIVVLDEAWRVLGELSIARWLRGAWKLARAYGVQMVAVLDRLSDLTASGDAGSEQVQLAKGLLEDAETRVVFRQSPGELAAVRDLLGLSDTEIEVLSELPRGVALWRVGRRSFIVEHRLGRSEVLLVDTDARMSDEPRIRPVVADVPPP